MNKEDYFERVKTSFQKICNREATKSEIKYFVDHLKKGIVTINELDDFISQKMKNIKEIKFHTAKGELTTEEWMKKSWDERAKEDAESLIWYFSKKTPDEYWSRGPELAQIILGVGTNRYDLILHGKDPKELRILEIGCGMGRILIPMSKIFGEVIGVDNSSKMIDLGKEFLKNIPNCKTYVNNGTDLSMFPENYFDFCFTEKVFHHIPDKKIIRNYINEVSRVLKKDKIFRIHVFGSLEATSDTTDSTIAGVKFIPDEMHKIAKKTNFEIIEEEGEGTVQYHLTLKSSKD